MASFLRMSEAASLAMHAMAMLAADAERKLSNAEIAERLDASGAHLSKVFQRLGKAGFVRSTPGPGGGFSLARSSDRITLLDIYRAFEGSAKPDVCLLSRPVCGGNCILGDLLERVNGLVFTRLAETNLSHLAAFLVKEKNEKKPEDHRNR